MKHNLLRMFYLNHGFIVCVDLCISYIIIFQTRRRLQLIKYLARKQFANSISNCFDASMFPLELRLSYTQKQNVCAWFDVVISTSAIAHVWSGGHETSSKTEGDRRALCWLNTWSAAIMGERPPTVLFNLPLCLNGSH